MKYAEIDMKLTEILADYISRGYAVNTATMQTLSARERGKVDVTNGKEIVRILINEFQEDAEMEETGRVIRLYGVSLIVGRASEKLTPHKNNLDGIWNSNLDVVSEQRFYRVGDMDSEWYGTKAEAIAREKKHRKRRSDSWESEFVLFGEEAKGIVLSFLRRQKNCKTATAKNITRVYKRCLSGNSTEYGVAFKGHNFVMK